MKRKYGIWGFGVVGKSVLRHLLSQGHQISIMDKQMPAPDELKKLESQGISFFLQAEQAAFLEGNDYIIASPGIDISSAAAYQHKFIEELDLFAAHWKKPIIAVTGSLGKTSVVHTLSKILTANGLLIATGGNIGTGMLDLLAEQENSDYALLELSSFQLERTKHFAPALAIWTNLYQNHLDRHSTMQNYFAAKYQIMARQNNKQMGLLHLALMPQIKALTNRPVSYFSLDALPGNIQLSPDDSFYTLEDNTVVRYNNGAKEKIFTLDDSQMIGYKENWVMLIAGCHLLGLTEKVTFTIPDIELPAHRLEKVAAIAGTTFYNDSKSSVMEATIAAVERLQPASIHLMLGGISKGVDRVSLIRQLKGKVKEITCFGAEAENLMQGCRAADIKATSHVNLESAFDYAVKQKPEILLFSPAGASFDLFKNYIERGEAFKKLVSLYNNQL